MTRAATPLRLPSSTGDPPWELARQFPLQGQWTEAEYLALHDRILVEFTDGVLEFPPMPTERHQRIVLSLLRALLAWVEPHALGVALMAPLRVRVRPGKYREPDVVFMLAQNTSRRSDSFWEGADLVVEVVSPDDPARDIVLTREDYARAAISEYWIVDPASRSITVLFLEGGQYREHDRRSTGEARSLLLAGFAVNVDDVWRL